MAPPSPARLHSGSARSPGPIPPNTTASPEAMQNRRPTTALVPACAHLDPALRGNADSADANADRYYTVAATIKRLALRKRVCPHATTTASTRAVTAGCSVWRRRRPETQHRRRRFQPRCQSRCQSGVCYDAFGQLTAASENFGGTTTWTNPYRYDGRDGVRYDGEMGLYWMSVRAYDPTLAASSAVIHWAGRRSSSATSRMSMGATTH